MKKQFFCLGIVEKMDPKNMKLYVGNELYFIVDQYQKDTVSKVFMLKMLTIFLVLMLIEYYYTKKQQWILY